jgi:hypothetical protein
MKTKNEMKVVPGMVDLANVIGFVKVENFDGKSIHINPRYLKTVVDMINLLDELDDIEIGISDKGAGGFFIFTDKKREAAIGVAGRSKR